MQLYITEKPSVAKALVEYFNKNGGEFKLQKDKGFYLDPDQDATITWSVGHIMGLYEPKKYKEEWGHWNINELPIIPPNYEFKKFVHKNYSDRFKVIQNLLKTATTVIHCGDPDREGQALIDEILETVDTKKMFVKRLLLNALDDKSIKDALLNLKDNASYSGLYAAANARAYIDWLIGMNLTRFYTCMGKAGGLPGTLSVGRVKTPTLALIVKRERELRDFKKRTYYTVHPFILLNDVPIQASYTNKVEFDTFESAEAVRNAFIGKSAVITSIDRKEVVQEIKELHNLDTLQIEASKRYGFTPKNTLAILQKLYEKKLTTYPRSDCKYLPESQASDAATILENINKSGFLPAIIPVPTGRAYDKPLPYNDKKITAHHAIIPTVNPIPQDLPKEEFQIYKLIAEKYASMYLPAYRYNQEIINFTVEDVLNESVDLKITIKNVTEEGYKVLTKGIETEDPEKGQNEEDEEIAGSFNVNENDICPIGTVKTVERTTKPPKRYTAGTLIKAMTNINSEDKKLNKILKKVKGIGTPATRANIVDELTNSGLLTYDKKNLVPSKEAELLIDMLPLELQGAEYTALMEIELDKVQSGTLAPVDVVKQIESFINTCIKNKEIKQVFDKSYPCPVCKKGYLIYKNYKKDKELIRYFRCTECNNTFNAMPDLNEPDYVPCPECKTGYIKEKRITKGKNKGKTFYGCSNYPECKKSYPNEEEYRKLANQIAKERREQKSAIEEAFK
ncbi:DNA topoisomerase [Veillonella seminalis]|uniref:DNA topoisomerase n=1 Tax=Veillonella seminalis ACS-216-V-Col6b TaxID=883156 RepID=K9DEV2_9FIRM|nr:DNA topoisomerase [Veillonella seminalis]EKU77392.1 DNA topoisomerase III [Veillonella seminalis ACS-216-V-Col6b]